MSEFNFVFFKFSFFIGGLIPLFLGMLIFLKDKKNLTGRTYFGLSVSCAVWSLGFIGLITSDNYDAAYFWRTFMDVGAILLPAFWIHFLYTVLIKDVIKKLEIKMFYTVATLLVILNLADYFIRGLFVTTLIKKSIFVYYPVPGFGYYLFLAFYIVAVPYSFYVLLSNLKVVSRNTATQLKFLFVSSLLGFGGGGTAFLLTFNIQIPPYGIVLFAFYPVVVAYTISKHRLFDIKVIITELLTFGIWVFVLARTYISETMTDTVINAGLLVFLIISGILLIRSVTNEVEQREKIEKLAGELGETNDRQEKLIHFIGHEVKGYLTKSEGAFSGMVEGDYGPISDEIRKLATLALKEDRKGVKAVTDILLASNQKKGTVNYEMKPFDFKKMVSRAVAEIKPEVLTKGLKINLNVEMAPSYEVNGDEAQLEEHLVRNLLKNAINYTPQGSITVSLSRNENKILFGIKDTGIGINEEDKSRLFTEGGRGKESIKTNVNSTGYGLFIAKGIVEAHHGRIWVESLGSGKGSTFFVELLAY